MSDVRLSRSRGHDMWICDYLYDNSKKSLSNMVEREMCLVDTIVRYERNRNEFARMIAIDFGTIVFGWLVTWFVYVVVRNCSGAMD